MNRRSVPYAGVAPAHHIAGKKLRHPGINRGLPWSSMHALLIDVEGGPHCQPPHRRHRRVMIRIVNSAMVALDNTSVRLHGCGPV